MRTRLPSEVNQRRSAADQRAELGVVAVHDLIRCLQAKFTTFAGHRPQLDALVINDLTKGPHERCSLAYLHLIDEVALLAIPAVADNEGTMGRQEYLTPGISAR